MYRAPLTFLLALACSVSMPALASGPSVDEATDADRKRAQELFGEAMERFEAHEYDAALEGFRRSHQAVRSPNSRFMVARTLARLGHNPEAYAELLGVVADAEALGERYADTAQAARAKRDELRPRVGLLTVTLRGLPKGTRVTIDEEALDASQIGQPLPVLPGRSEVVAVTPDGTRYEEEVKVAGGGAASVELAPRGPDAARRDLAYIERDDHPWYILETELHGSVSMFEPPGGVGTGAGLGGRLSVQLLPSGIVSGLNDGVALTAGADWIGTSDIQHLWVPVTGQYNLWITEDLSLLLEPGVAFFSASERRFVRPVLQGGARYRVVGRVHVLLRLGTPMATLGASVHL